MTENTVIAKCLTLALFNNGDLNAADFRRITNAIDSGEVDNLSSDAFKAWIGELVYDTFRSHALKVLGGTK